MTKFIFIRHGQSEGNDLNIFAGHLDVPLTELGKRQAELTAEFLQDRQIDCIYASDLTRARQTAEPLCRRRGMELRISKGLREIDGGNWEGVRFDELARRFPESYHTWMSDLGAAVCDGGESIAQVQARVAGAVAEIAAANEGKTVCVVTHATPIRVLGCLWLGIPISDAKDVPWVHNAAVCTADCDGGVWTLREYDLHAHLSSCDTALPADV